MDIAISISLPFQPSQLLLSVFNILNQLDSGLLHDESKTRSNGLS